MFLEAKHVCSQRPDGLVNVPLVSISATATGRRELTAQGAAVTVAPAKMENRMRTVYSFANGQSKRQINPPRNVEPHTTLIRPYLSLRSPMIGLLMVIPTLTIAAGKVACLWLNPRLLA